jgi:hypothetical protein
MNQPEGKPRKMAICSGNVFTSKMFQLIICDSKLENGNYFSFCRTNSGSRARVKKFLQSLSNRFYENLVATRKPASFSAAFG